MLNSLLLRCSATSKVSRDVGMVIHRTASIKSGCGEAALTEKDISCLLLTCESS